MPIITVNQSDIFYYDNELEGTPHLFIHGWLGSSLEWSYQLFYFTSRKHIILIDLPGFGNSDRSKRNYSVDFYTNQILDFLKLLGYNEVVLIGHSLGGVIAQYITIQNPKLVKKLVLISSDIAISKTSKDKFKLFWVNLVFKLFYKQVLKNIIKRIISKEKESREFQKLTKYAFELPKSIVLSTFKNMTLKFNLKKKLYNISQDTLIIYGNMDNIISKSMLGNLNDLIPQSDTKIIDSGSHRLMYENYSKVNDFIDEFINK
ncbi:MAG: alpha/beta fold hydrolase [Promethearchaeota archaeon]